MMYGIDVGGTKIEIAIFDDNEKKTDCWRVATPVDSYENFGLAIEVLVKEADSKCGSIGTVGIGLPGFVDQGGNAISSNVPCINERPIKADICRRLNRVVGFENDVKAFVYSEANGGAAADYKYVIGVVLGTGVAGGLCVNRELYYGRQNIAGEYGHMALPMVLKEKFGFPIKDCGCGLKGCVEQYLSGPGLLWMSGYYGGKYSAVADLVFSLRGGDDELANKIFETYIECLGCYFAELTMLFDPDVIVLGGGLSNIDEIYQKIPKAISSYLFSSATAPMVLPPMYGDSSGVRGAALIGRKASEQSSIDLDEPIHNKLDFKRNVL